MPMQDVLLPLLPNTMLAALDQALPVSYTAFKVHTTLVQVLDVP